MTLKQIWTFKRDMSVKIKTLLVLNLIAVIFAISCSVDYTKPEASKASLYESQRGTKLYTNASASSTTPITVSTFADVGENVTAINCIKMGTNGTYTDVEFTTVLNSAGEVYSITPTGLSATTNIIVSYSYYKNSLTTNSYGIANTPTFQDYTTDYSNPANITDPSFIQGKSYIASYQYGATTITNSGARITNEGSIYLNATVTTRTPLINSFNNVIIWVY